MDVLASVGGFVCFGCLFRHYCVSVQCDCSLRRSSVYVLMFLTLRTHIKQFKTISPNSRMMYLRRSDSFVSVVCSGITVFQCSVVVHSAVVLMFLTLRTHIKQFKTISPNSRMMYLRRSDSFVSVVCSCITVFQCSVVVHSAVLSCTC